MDPDQTRQEVKKHLTRFKSLEETVKYEGNNHYEYRRGDDDFEIFI